MEHRLIETGDVLTNEFVALDVLVQRGKDLMRQQEEADKRAAVLWDTQRKVENDAKWSEHYALLYDLGLGALMQYASHSGNDPEWSSGNYDWGYTWYLSGLRIDIPGYAPIGLVLNGSGSGAFVVAELALVHDSDELTWIVEPHFARVEANDLRSKAMLDDFAVALAQAAKTEEHRPYLEVEAQRRTEVAAIRAEVEAEPDPPDALEKARAMEDNAASAWALIAIAERLDRIIGQMETRI